MIGMRTGTESLLTLRRRKVDSNHRFLQAREAFDASAYLRAKREGWGCWRRARELYECPSLPAIGNLRSG